MNKYGAKSVTLAGKRFHSQAEATRYQELCLLEKAKEISSLSTQVPFDLDVNHMHVCTLVMDFTYTENGRLIAEESKGFMQEHSRIKHKLFRALYPEWEFRLNGVPTKR